MPTRDAARNSRRLLLMVAAGLLCFRASPAAQVLETETARLNPKGVVEAGFNLEIQTSTEGHEAAIPLVFEYGITDRWALVIEPVAGTWIRPNAGMPATGGGDTEITLQYLAKSESHKWPAIALASEVKLPTTQNHLIGTGQTDVAAYVIASKRWGRLDAHVNVAYTVVGQPPDATLSNTLGFALAGLYTVTPRWRLFGEALSTTAATGQGESALSPDAPLLVPEAAAQELVGTVGAGLYVTPKIFLSLGISYDNTHALLFRPGITFQWK